MFSEQACTLQYMPAMNEKQIPLSKNSATIAAPKWLAVVTARVNVDANNRELTHLYKSFP